MTVGEYLSDRRESGHIRAEDMILGVSSADGDKNSYYAVVGGTTEISAGIISEVIPKKYVINGTGCLKRNAYRKFTILADRMYGDQAQELLLGKNSKFGVYGSCEINYVYFCAAGGDHEKGRAVVSVISDGRGECGSESEICVELYGVSIDEEEEE